MAAAQQLTGDQADFLQGEVRFPIQLFKSSEPLVTMKGFFFSFFYYQHPTVQHLFTQERWQKYGLLTAFTEKHHQPIQDKVWTKSHMMKYVFF